MSKIKNFSFWPRLVFPTRSVGEFLRRVEADTEKKLDWETLPKLMSLRETSAVLGVHPNTLRLWDQRGTLRAVRLGSRQDRRYKREQVRQLWLTMRPTPGEELTQRWIARHELLHRLRRAGARPWVAVAALVIVAVVASNLDHAFADQSTSVVTKLQAQTCTGWTNAQQAMVIEAPDHTKTFTLTKDNSAQYSSDFYTVRSTKDGISTGSVDTPSDTIACRGFSVRRIPAGATITAAKLIVSFQARSDATTTASFSVQTSLDGSTWTTIHVLPATVDAPIQTALDLTAISRDQLANLRVRVVPEVDIDNAPVTAQLDGIEVRTTSAIPAGTTSTGTSKAKQTLDRLVAFSKSAYSAEETPVMIVPKRKVTKVLFVPTKRVEWAVNRVTLVDQNGNETEASYTTRDSQQGDNISTALALQTTNIHPGRYRLNVTMTSSDGGAATSSKDFLWGVVAVNFDHATPRPGQPVQVAVAVLDDAGRTICDANVEAKLTDPHGKTTTFSTEGKSIVRNSNCFDKGVTNSPDYRLQFTPTVAGTYHFALRAKTAVGERAYEENLLVSTTEKFDIQRSTEPTRIYPPAPYTVTIGVTPLQDYVGVVTERVPANFLITTLLPEGSIVVAASPSDHQLLEWSVDWKKGQTYLLHYTFDAPDVSPALFTTGPLSIASNTLSGYDYLESRAWQIASDTLVKKSKEDMTFTPLPEAPGDWDPTQPALITTAKPIYNADEQVNIKLWSKGFALAAKPNQPVTIKNIEVTATGGPSAGYDEAHDLLTQDGLERTVVYLVPNAHLRPGTYTVTATLSDDTTIAKSFEWGTLQVVTDAQENKKRKTITFRIADTDAQARLNCSSTMSLAVTTPSGTVETFTVADGTIEPPKVCDNTVPLSEERYTVKYFPLESGLYTYRLTRTEPERVTYVSGSTTVSDRDEAPPSVAKDIARDIHTTAATYKHDDQPVLAVQLQKIGAVGEPVKRTVDAIRLVRPDGSSKVVPIAPTEEAVGSTVNATYPIDPSEFRRPGKYKLLVDVGQDGYVSQVTQDFYWGVLAVNLRRSIERPATATEFGLAVLDDEGRTLCDASLEMTITDPQGRATTLSSASKTITVNPKCADKTVTNDFDYVAKYTTAEPGVYRLHVVADTSNGQRTLDDSFEVRASVNFDIDRTVFSMRIYPGALYAQQFTIVANADYTGPVTESVPSSFELSAVSDQGVVTAVAPDRQHITWYVDWKAGETHTLGYTIKFPSISPEYYVLGPLTVGEFKEARQWQVASDAVTPSGTLGFSETAADDNMQWLTYTSTATFTDQGGSVDTTTNANDLLHVVVKNAPTRNELLAGQLEINGTMHITRRDSSAVWTEELEVASVTATQACDTTLGACNLGFNMAYEQLSGRAVVFYGKAANDGILYYNIWNGSSWAGEASTTFRASSTFDTRFVVAKPERGTKSDRILVMVSDADNDIYALIFDAGTPGDLTTITGTSSNTNSKNFDGDWETTTRDAVVFWAEAESSAVNPYRYKVYDHGTDTWDGSGTNPGNTHASANIGRWVNAVGDGRTNRIAVSLAGSASDMRPAIWKSDDSTAGLTFGNEEIAQETLLTNATGVAWENYNAGTPFAMWVYSANAGNSDASAYQTWTSGTGFSNETDMPLAMGDDSAMWKLYASPNNDEIMGVGIEWSDDLCFQRWSGTAWASDCTTTEYSTTLPPDSATAHNEQDAFDFSYTPYSPWSRNWQFYSGTDVATTPTVSLANENVTPTAFDSAAGKFRLRFSVAELGGLSQADARKKLQYTTGTPDDPATTWTDVDDPAGAGIWRYVDCDGGDTDCNDGQALAGTVLSGTPTAGWWTQDKDLAATTGMDQTAETVRELEYSVEANTAAASTTYYFRMYDLDIQSPVLREQDNDGANDCATAACTYPSLTTAAQTITIGGTCDEYNQTTNCGDLGDIRVAVGGSLQAQLDANGGGGPGGTDGTFSIASVPKPSTNAIVTVFVDGAPATAGNRAVAITKYDGTGDITGLQLFKEHLTIGSADTGASLSSAELGSYDNSVASGDDDVFFDYRTDWSSNAMTATGGAITGFQIDCDSPATSCNTFSTQEELHIKSGWTYAPATVVATHDLENAGGTFSVGTNTVTISGSYVSSGTLSKSATQTMNFTSTATGETITPGTGNFANVIFNGTGGDWTPSAAVNIDEALTMTAGQLKGTQNVTVLTDVIGTAGTINLTGGTFEQRVNAAEDFGPTTASTAWTFANLQFSNSGSTARTITKQSCATCGVTVTGVMTIGKTADTQITTLDAGNSSWTLSGNGTPFVVNYATTSPVDRSVLTPNASTFIYTHGTSATVAPETYNHLQTNGAGTYTVAAPASSAFTGSLSGFTTRDGTPSNGCSGTCYTGTATGADNLAYNGTAGQYSADQFAEITIAALGTDEEVAPCVRINDTGAINYYCMDRTGTNYEITEKTAGATTALGSTFAAPVVGDTLRLEVSGTSTATVRAYINGVLVQEVSDASPRPSGNPGLNVYRGGGAPTAAAEDWKGGSMLITNADITNTQGTLALGDNVVNVKGGDISISGVLSQNGNFGILGGSVMVETTGSIGGSGTTTFGTLYVGSAATNQTTTAGGNMIIRNRLRIVSSTSTNAFDASTRTINLSGNATASEVSSLQIASGETFTASSSTVIYDGDAATTVALASYNNLEVKPATNSITHSLAGGGTITVGGNMVVGDGIKTGVIVTAETNDPILDVNGNFTVANNTTFNASSSAAFTIAGDFSNSAGGTFGEGTGLVTLDGLASKNLNSGCTDPDTCTTTNFYDLAINKTDAADGNDNITLTNGLLVTNTLTVTDGELKLNSNFARADGATTSISINGGANPGKISDIAGAKLTLGAGGLVNNGTLYLDEQGNNNGCLTGDDDSITLTSNDGITVRPISGTGTFTLYDVNVTLMNATVAITVNGGTDGGTNTGSWTFNSCGITVAGICRAYDQSTNCGDLGDIRVAVNGTLKSELDANGGTGGTWSIASVAGATAGSIITVFVDGAIAGDRAVGITRYDGTGDIANMVLYKEHLVLGSDDTGITLTSAELGSYDNSVSADADVFHEYSTAFTNSNCTTATGGATVCLQVDYTGFSTQEELLIKGGTTYRPDSGGSDYVVSKDIEIDGTITADSNAITAAGSFLVNGSGAYTAGTSTLTMNGTGTLTSGTSSLFNFVTSGGGTVTLANATHTVTGDLSLGSTGLTAGTSTVLMSGTKNIIGGGKTLNNLTIDGTNTTVSLITSDLTVGGVLTIGTASDGNNDTLSIDAGRILRLSSNSGTNMVFNDTSGGTNTVSGAGALLYENATTTFPTTGVVSSVLRFGTANGNMTLPVRGYGGDVVCLEQGGFSCILGTAGGQTLNFSANLILQNTATGITLNGSTNNPDVNVTGNVTVVDADVTTSIISMGSGTWTVGGDFNLTNLDTLNHNGGTLTMTGATKTITANGKTLNALAVSGTIANVGTLTLAGSYNQTAGTFTQAANTTMTVNGTAFTLANGATWVKTSGTGKLVIDNVTNINFADNNGTKQDMGAIQIGASPGTTTLTTDMSATTVTIPTGDTFNTKGYDVTTTGAFDCQGTCILDLTDTAPNNETDGTILDIGGDFSMSATGTLTAYTNSKLFMNSTAGTDTNRTFTTGGKAYNEVELKNAGGTNDDITISGTPLDVNSTLTLTDGQIRLDTNDPNVTLNGNLSINANATVTKADNGTATWTFDGATSPITWTDGTGSGGQDLGLVIINGTTKTVNLLSSAKATKLTIATGQTFGLASSGYTFTLTGSGQTTARPLQNSGTLNEGTNSTFAFTGTAATDIDPETFYHLVLAPSGAGSPTYYLDPGEIGNPTNVSGNLTIGDATNAVTIINGAFTALTISGDMLIQTSAAYSSSSDVAMSIGSSYTNNGTFTDNGGGVSFTATTTGKTLNGSMTGSNKFVDLIFSGSGGEWTNTATLETNSLSMSAGTLLGSANITVNGPAVGTAGVINRSGGTFETRTSTSYNFGPTTASTAWTFNDLTFGNSHASAPLTVTTQNCSACTVTVSGVLRVGKSGDAAGATTTLTGATSTWNLTGTSADPFILLSSPAGAFTANTSTVNYNGVNGSGNVNITTTNYSSLGCSPGSAEILDVAGSFTVSALLTIGTNCSYTIAGSQTTTLSANTGTSLTLNGTLTGTGRLTYQNSATTFPTSGTISGGILRFDMVNGNMTMPARTDYGAVEAYQNAGVARILTAGTAISQTLTMSSHLHVYADSAFNTTFEANTYDPVINVAGDIDFLGGGGGSETLSVGGGTWTVSGNVNITDGFYSNATGNTLVMNGTGGKTLTPNNASLYNFTVDPSSAATINISTSNVAVTNNLVVADGDTLYINTTLDMDNTTTCSVNLNSTGTISSPAFAGTFWYGCSNAFPSGGTVSLYWMIMSTISTDLTIPGRAFTGSPTTVWFYNPSASNRVVNIGTAGGQTFSATSNIRVYANSTGNLTVDASSNNPDFSISTDIDFVENSTGQSTLISGSGNLAFGGNVNMTNGTYTASTGNTLTMSGTSKTLTTAGNSLYNFTQTGGTVTMSGTTTLNNDLTVSSGTLTAPASGALNVAGDFVNDATFVHNSSTLTLNGTTSTTLDTGCVTVTTCTNEDLYSLVINKTAGVGANDEVTLTSTGVRVANTLTVTAGELVQGALNVQVDTSGSVSVAAAGIWTNISTGDLYLGGGFDNAGSVTFSSSNAAQCTDVADDIVIDSTVDNTLRTWSGAGTYTMRNINVDDMSDGAITITIYTSTKSGDTDWTEGTCGIDVSGTIYQSSSEGTAFDCSGGNTVNLRAATNGGTNASGQCTAAGGTFTITGVADPGGADVPMVIFIDSGDSTKATTVTLSAAGGTNITGLTLIMDRVVVTQQSGTAITNTHLKNADNTSAGIRYSVTTAVTDNLLVESGMELHVLSGKTFTPGGTVTTTATGTAAGAAGDLHIAGVLTMGTNSLTVGGDYTNAGTLNKTNTQTTTLAATGSGFTLTPGTGDLNNLTVSGDAGGNGTYTLSGANLTVDGALTVNAGDTLTIDTSRTLTNTGATNVNNDGTINGAGTLQFTSASGGPDTDANSTGTYSATTRYNATGGSIASTTFDARTYSGRVELYQDNTTAANRTVTPVTDGTYTLSGGSSHLYLINDDAAQTLTLAGTSASAVFTIGGDLDFTGTGGSSEIIQSGNDVWTVAGNVDLRGGTYTAATGNELKMTGTANFYGNSQTFYNLTIDGAGNTVTSQEISTITNALTVGGAADGNNDTLTLTASFTYSTSTGSVVFGGSGTDTINGTGVLVLRNDALDTDGAFGGTVMVKYDTYQGVTGLNVVARQYKYLSIDNLLAEPGQTVTLGTAGGQTITVDNDFTIDCGGCELAATPNTIDGESFDPIVNVSGSFLMNDPVSGTYDMSMGSSAWTVGANFDLSFAGTFSHSSGTLIMNGTGTLTSNGKTLYSFTTSGSGTVTLLSTTHTFAGNVTLGSSGLTAGTSTVVMTGTANLVGGGKSLNNLTIDGTNNTVSMITSDLTVGGTLTVGSGDALSIDTSRTLTNTGATDANNDGTISGAGTLTFTNASGGPNSDANSTGTYSSVVRFDTTGGNIASTTFDARTYSGKVELYSNSTSARTISMATGTYTLSGASSHLHILAANTADLTIAGDANNPTVVIGGDLDFTGSGSGFEVLAAGTGTWTVSGNANFTDGVFGPSVAAIGPSYADTARRTQTISFDLGCALDTTYSCLGTGIVQYGNTVVGDCLGNNEDQFINTDRGWTQYDLSSLNGAATITGVTVGVNVTATYSSTVSVARSTTDALNGQSCTSASGTWSKIGNATYGTVDLSTTGNKIIPLGSTGIVDVDTRAGSATPLAIGLQSSTTEATMGSISAAVSTRPALYAAYTTSTSPTLVMNGSSKTLTPGGNGFYNLSVSGTVTFANEAVLVSGNLDLTGGDVTPGTSTVTMLGAGKTLTAPVAGDTLYNVTVNPTSSGTVTFNASGGDLTMSNQLAVGIASDANDDEFSIGSGRTVTLSLSSGSSLVFGNSGTDSVTGAGRLTYMTSTAFPTTGTISSILRYDATTATSQSLTDRTYGGPVEIYNNSGGAKTVAAGAVNTLVFSSTLDLSVGSGSVTLDLNSTDPTTTTVSGALTIGANATLSAPSTNAFNVNGNYTNNGTFTDNSGTVTLAGAAQQTLSGTMTGASDFNNLTITNSSGSDPDASPSVIFGASLTTAGTFQASTANVKLRFTAASTYTLNTINLSGTAGNLVTLRSSTPGTATTFNAGAGSRTVTYASIQDSNACGSTGGEIDASDGTNVDKGNAACWLIGKLTVTLSGTTVNLTGVNPLTTSFVNFQGVTSTVTTNATNGYISTVSYSGALSNGTDTLADAGGSATAGTSGFGASTSKASQSLAQTDAPACSTTQQQGSGPYTATSLTTAGAQFASAVGTATNDATTLCFLGAISGTQVPGLYSTTVTLVTTARF